MKKYKYFKKKLVTTPTNSIFVIKKGIVFEKIRVFIYIFADVLRFRAGRRNGDNIIRRRRRDNT